MTFDIKICGGEVLDGWGTPPVRADIGIRGETIAAVGDLSAAGASTTIDADGRLCCPGFIDAHSHSDTYLLIEPSARSKLFQGVTTEIVGNCGSSAAPIGDRSHLPSDWAEKTYPGAWNSVAEYRTLLDAARPAVNVALLIGHNTLRRHAVGYDNRPAAAPELRRMLALLEQGMEEGARGLSTGLVYTPGMYAPPEEIRVLAAAAGRRGGIYASHMRSEGARLLEAIDETISIGRAAGLRVEISHLKTAGRGHWDKLDDALRAIRAARDAGIEVAADRYPYTAGATDLDVVFPPWAAEGGRDAILRRLADGATRARLRAELIESRPREEWAGVVIGSTTAPENRRLRGMNLLAAAEGLDTHPVDVVLRLCETDGLTTGAFFAGMSEANLFRILAEPYVMLGSDASVRAPTGPLAGDFPHPRAYGAFVRFLLLSMEGKTVALPEAVRKMTSLPASHFNLARRGAIAEGMYADIAVFDPRQLKDRASYADPHHVAEGVECVVVNGTPTLASGTLTGRRAGRFL